MAVAREAARNSVAGNRTAADLASDLGDLLRNLKALFDPYRPELHYMRGPGPKWRAKHAPAAVATEIPAAPALVRISAR
jgi:hypothetical protein